jgi:hypothetical protein
MLMSELSDHERFAIEIVKGASPDLAWQRVFGSKPGASEAYKLRQKPAICKLIEKYRKLYAEFSGPPESDEIAVRLWEEIQVQADDFEITGQPGKYREPEDLTDAQRRCVEGIDRAPDGHVRGYKLTTIADRWQRYLTHMRITHGSDRTQVSVSTTQVFYGLRAQLEAAIEQDAALDVTPWPDVAPPAAEVPEQDIGEDPPQCFLPPPPVQPQPTLPQPPAKPPALPQAQFERLQRLTPNEMPRSNVRDEYGTFPERYFGVDADCWGSDREWRDRVK